MSRPLVRSLALCVVVAGAFLAAYSQQPPTVQVGYAVLTAGTGLPVPVAAAVFTYTNSQGIIVSQAGVGSAPPLLRSRLFIDQRGTRTGVALVNTAAQAATVNLVLRDPAGAMVGQQSLSLIAGEHRSKYIDELFPALPPNFIGSITFDSNRALSAIALRERTNAYREFLYSTLPVVDLGAAGGSQLVFPHLAAGLGFRTQVILVNRGAGNATGTVRFFATNGSPLTLRANNADITEMQYSIPPDGVYQVELDAAAPGLATGYAVLNSAAGTSAPAGAIIFRLLTNDTVVTEAAVPASPATTLSRVYASYLGARTGVAIANPSQQTANVSLKLMDRYGLVESTASLSLPAGAQTARFVDEFFSGVSEGFSGLMEIQSSVAVVPLAIDLRVNSRADTILTTLPVADLTVPASAGPLILPQIATGLGFTTRLILMHAGSTADANGQVRFVQSNGTPMVLPLGTATGDNFAFQVPVGSGRQLYPGTGAAISSLTLLDATTGQPTTELSLAEGTTIRPRLRIVDSTGVGRDDIDGSFQSLKQDIASVDASGLVRGVKAGFSTITISAGGLITTAAATVVKVDSGVPGFNVLGVVQDLSQGFYLAAPEDHTVLRLENLAQVPVVYAGTRLSPGLKNDARLQSQFRQPSYLALDQSSGDLYVSDTANHAIRRIRASTPVATIAGTGVAGAVDGAASQARFSSPQGIALDGRGFLWIADSGNHTIRRLNLVTGTVDTVAGSAGVPGGVDGTGGQARFRNPTGVAVVNETVEEQLERELLGQPPPPVEVVVADTGNSAIRAVDATGIVTTISPGTSSPLQLPANRPDFGLRNNADSLPPVTFSGPRGIAVDASGNIYFTEPGAGRVRVILRTGSRARSGTVLNVTPSYTGGAPQSLVVGSRGDVVITDPALSLRRIQSATPQITAVAPERISAAGGQTLVITGANFSPDVKVTIAGTLGRNITVVDTQTIRVTTPALPSGNAALAVVTRSGSAQAALVVLTPSSTELLAGDVTTLAGGSTRFGDGGAPASAALVAPGAMAFGGNGVVYVVERLYHRVRKIDLVRGVITTVAGNGQEGFAGDGGQAVAATLSFPAGVAVDPSGDLYIADTGNNRIREVAARTGIITTVAGNGVRGFGGDNGPARSAVLNRPDGIAADSSGNVFITDSGNHRVRKIDETNDVITTVAGNGSPGFSGDFGPATSASLNLTSAQVRGLAVDSQGNLFISDTGNDRIRVVTPSGTILTYVGAGASTPFGISGTLTSPTGIAIDSAGRLFIADTGNQAVKQVGSAFRQLLTVAGNGTAGFSGDSAPAITAQLNFPGGVAVDSSGNLLISDQFNYRIRHVDAKSQKIATIAGTGSDAFVGDGKTATDVSLGLIDGVAVDAAGNLLFTDRVTQRIRRVDAVTRRITTLAGNGTLGSNTAGTAVNAVLNSPAGIALDSAGNAYFSDKDNHVIRKINMATGEISTVTGTGSAGYSGDNGPAVQAQINLGGSLQRRGIALDKNGNLYFSDVGNSRIRRVDAATGVIRTVAGNSFDSFTGDGSRAVTAGINTPAGLVIDGGGNIYFADSLNHRIRRVDAVTGVIATFAGSGPSGAGQGAFDGDGGPAISARLNVPLGVAIDSSGNLYIADALNNRIRRVSVAGVITTIAGTGIGRFSGDGASATRARFNFPSDLVFDASGNLYVADTQNYRVRVIRGPLP